MAHVQLQFEQCSVLQNKLHGCTQVRQCKLLTHGSIKEMGGSSTKQAKPHFQRPLSKKKPCRKAVRSLTA